MAKGGSDRDISDMLLEDADREDDLDQEGFSVHIQNSFDMRPDMRPGWGNDGNDGWQLMDRQSKKRKKFSSSSMDNESFKNLSNDEKLVCLFDSLNKNYEKLSSIENTQRQCMNDNSNMNTEMAKTDKRVAGVQKCINIHTQKLKLLAYRSIDIESRSRRNNIVFWGITERLSRDCKQLIHNFMRDELFLDPSEMCIERAHRLGSLSSDSYRNKRDPKRPIIVRFRDYTDTELVIDQAWRLKRSGFGLDRDYPKEIAMARKELYSSNEAKEGRSKQQRVQIKYPAKLYIEGRLVSDKFPGWFKVLNQSRIDGFEPDVSVNTFQALVVPISEQPGQSNLRMSQDSSQLNQEEAAREASFQLRPSQTQAYIQQTSAQNDMSPPRSAVRSPGSTTVSSKSPSLFRQNVNNGNSETTRNHVSRERTHSTESRASNKNLHIPQPDSAQHSRVFKSPVQRGRSTNRSSNANSNRNISKNQNTDNRESKTRSLSQSVSRVRASRSISKNRTDKNPPPNIDRTENQHDPGGSA